MLSCERSWSRISENSASLRTASPKMERALREYRPPPPAEAPVPPLVLAP